MPYKAERRYLRCPTSVQPAVGVAVLARILVSGDQEAVSAGGGVLDDVLGGRAHHGDHAADERARGEVLTGAEARLVGVLSMRLMSDSRCHSAQGLSTLTPVGVKS